MRRFAGQLDAALADDCPLASREGGFIRDGFHPPLDALRELAHGGKQWIARYQAQESQRTGIPSLKVGFNKVFGYYLEITNAHRDQIPDDYIRKQTVKNAERFITPELKEYEEKVLTADEKSKELEYELFLELREAVSARGGGCKGPPPCWRSWTCWWPWPSWPGSATTAAGDRRGTAACDPRRAAPGAGRAGAGGHVRAQRRDGRRRGGQHPLDHRPEHGRQEHLYPPGGADRAVGADGQFRARRRGDDRPVRPHFHPRGGQRRAGPRPEHLHGRDDRDGADPQHGHRRGAW